MIPEYLHAETKEIELAMMLWVHGICCAEMKKLFLAARRKRLRKRDMKWGQQEEPDTRHHVIAWLLKSRWMWSVDYPYP